jgi:hypothetical protein
LIPGLSGPAISEWCDGVGTGNFDFEYIEVTNY